VNALDWRPASKWIVTERRDGTIVGAVCLIWPLAGERAMW